MSILGGKLKLKGEPLKVHGQKYALCPARYASSPKLTLKIYFKKCKKNPLLLTVHTPCFGIFSARLAGHAGSLLKV